MKQNIEELNSNQDYKVEIFNIAMKMLQSGLPKPFIVAAIETAFEFEGAYDLMKMWEIELDSKERDEIIADIQELIEDCQLQDKVEEKYVRFDDLETIAKNITDFKNELRLVVDEQGGLNRLAELTNIPQPSLSRFFNSAAMPRKITLLKIAKALNMKGIEIDIKWSK